MILFIIFIKIVNYDNWLRQRRNSVRLAIRKIMYAPSKQGEQPSVEVSKEFMMSPNKLHLEASLDKELYHHGENIAVNVHIANNSNRTVKKIKVTVRQFADICLFSTAQYKCTVAEAESEWVLPNWLPTTPYRRTIISQSPRMRHDRKIRRSRFRKILMMK